MDKPAMKTFLQSSRTVATVAIFTAVIIATDYGLAPLLNVKLMDTLVFSAAFVFGFRIGAYIAISSELIWGFFSPFGFGGYIIPFLILGELLFAFAGYLASRLWSVQEHTSLLSQSNFFFGAILLICAFVWDLETNFATGLIAGAHTFSSLLAYEILGIVPFAISHEIADFVLGSFLAPIIIVYFARMNIGRTKLLARTEEQSIK
jgi:hypothetical protein